MKYKGKEYSIKNKIKLRKHVINEIEHDRKLRKPLGFKRKYEIYFL